MARLARVIALAMLVHWQSAATPLVGSVGAAYAPMQQQLAPYPGTEHGAIRLPLHNVEDWLFTTSIGIGTPPQAFTAAIDVAWSDVFVPSIDCLTRPSSSCGAHPLFNPAASSSHRSIDRRSSIRHFGFYTSGPVGEDVLHLGRISVPGQIFEEADDLRPTYVFNDSWYDAPLGLARRTVRSDGSDLQAISPFQMLSEQGALQNNRFSIQLPQTPEDTGELVIGGVDDTATCSHCSSIELPLRSQQSSGSDDFHYVSEHSESYAQRTYFVSGGWEVQPVSVTFGNLTLELSDHTASFSSIQYWLDLPHAFASPMRDQLGVSIFDGSIDCDARSAGFPDLTFVFRGLEGTTHEISMTPDEYIRKTPIVSIIDPSKCQVPIAMHRSRDEHGDELPKFISLGNIFLRKFRSVFDADRESITLVAE